MHAVPVDPTPAYLEEKKLVIWQYRIGPFMANRKNQKYKVEFAEVSKTSEANSDLPDVFCNLSRLDMCR